MITRVGANYMYDCNHNLLRVIVIVITIYFLFLYVCNCNCDHATVCNQ